MQGKIIQGRNKINMQEKIMQGKHKRFNKQGKIVKGRNKIIDKSGNINQ